MQVLVGQLDPFLLGRVIQGLGRVVNGQIPLSGPLIKKDDFLEALQSER